MQWNDLTFFMTFFINQEIIKDNFSFQGECTNLIQTECY